MDRTSRGTPGTVDPARGPARAAPPVRVRRRAAGATLRPAAAAAALAAALGCRAERAGDRAAGGPRGTWAWASHPRPDGAPRDLVGLFSRGSGDSAEVRYDTLTLHADGRHVLRAAVARAALDGAGRPAAGPASVPGVPATVDSGRWHYGPPGPGPAGGPGALCTTHRGVAGWHCAPAVLRGDTLELGAGDGARAYRRVAGGRAGGGRRVPGA